MGKIVVSEMMHVVNATPPIDINGAGAASDYFSLENYAHASIIVQLGVTGAATTITVKEATAAQAAAGSGGTAIAFDYYAETTAAGDTLGDRTAATTSGITGSTNDGVFYVIEIDAAQLTAGYEWLSVCASNPSAATLYSCVAILSGARYADATTPTAIA